jgi:UTP--glucose-1-phosphate uridylyltransferase
MFGNNAGVHELVEHYAKHPSDVVLNATKTDPNSMTSLGMIRFSNGSQVQVEEVVEKPKLEEVDSDVASVSSYVFTPSLFDYLDPTSVQAPEEFQIQPAINKLIKKGKVTACISKGKFLTNGDVPSYLEMIVEEALSREDTREEFFKILQDKIESLE